MKDFENHLCKLERSILNQLIFGSVLNTKLKLKKPAEERVLSEMAKQGLIQLTKDGHALTTLGKWYLSNKETEKIDSLLVFDNAFIISKDTISKNGYNQISGKRLVGLFDEENRLKQVDVTKNAESIFYARNDKQELIGIDKSKSGSITILFDDGDIDEYTRYNQIDGNLYPESKFPEKERILKGFDWREEERPRSVDDLFKDDPPLELPIIKGLDDYIPQEDFVDETLIKRIKKADTKAKIKKGTISKASRNLPKNTFKAKGVSKNKTLQKNKRKKFLLEKPLPEK